MKTVENCEKLPQRFQNRSKTVKNNLKWAEKQREAVKNCTVNSKIDPKLSKKIENGLKIVENCEIPSGTLRNRSKMI